MILIRARGLYVGDAEAEAGTGTEAT
eukprot:COSAG01_NODE_53330_length_340_cov_0.593361_2_plen_25_part_01